MPRTKTVQIALRLTPSEKEKLSKGAAEARMSMSKYLLALSSGDALRRSFEGIFSA